MTKTYQYRMINKSKIMLKYITNSVLTTNNNKNNQLLIRVDMAQMIYKNDHFFIFTKLTKIVFN